jgi:acetyl esterase/lipase
MRKILISLFVLLIAVPTTQAGDPDWTRKEDVIYGRKFGTALTMDVFTPKKDANGIGLVMCVSGGWFSAKTSVNPGVFGDALNRGYTVFAVVHGSQPKFTIPEVLEDMHRAIRFIRHNAKTYNIDPDRIGIMGGSAGGHLSLMMGCTGGDGNPKAPDVIDRGSSKVQCVACLFPPTDFLNYGKEGNIALGRGTLTNFRAPFDFMEFDPKSRSFNLITDEAKRNEIGKRISPAYHVTDKSAPALIVHGDADMLVPIQQAELIIEKFKAAKVPCELVVKKGAGHGGKEFAGVDKTLVDWFDKHLGKK